MCDPGSHTYMEAVTRWVAQFVWTSELDRGGTYHILSEK